MTSHVNSLRSLARSDKRATVHKHTRTKHACIRIDPTKDCTRSLRLIIITGGAEANFRSQTYILDLWRSGRVRTKSPTNISGSTRLESSRWPRLFIVIYQIFIGKMLYSRFLMYRYISISDIFCYTGSQSQANVLNETKIIINPWDIFYAFFCAIICTNNFKRFIDQLDLLSTLKRLLKKIVINAI